MTVTVAMTVAMGALLRDVDFALRGVCMVVVMITVMVMVMGPALLLGWLGLSVSDTHVVSLEPPLHLDKANFSPTASTDKGK